MSVLLAPRPAAKAADPIRVMVVDDSVVMRGLVGRWLANEPDLEVVASLHNGRQAVDQIESVNPDVVILDIEMPELDGLAALPLLLAKRRDLVVIMASSLTRRHAEVSLRALALGATDYVPKPEQSRGISTSPEFRRELIDKLRALGERRKRRAASIARVEAARATPRTAADDAATTPSWQLRCQQVRPPRALLIGASTGGPQALTKLIAQLGRVVERAPVLIVQHMPATFTTILAEHLGRAAGRPVREPEDGEPVLPGVIHLAPGGRHMLVERREGRPVIRLHDGDPVNFCRPALDPLFLSAIPVWQGALLAVILTGMGHDGTDGARAIAAAGGGVIAQDEATSVVWGMPGSAAQAGVCSAVLPLGEIAPRIIRAFAGEQP